MIDMCTKYWMIIGSICLISGVFCKPLLFDSSEVSCEQTGCPKGTAACENRYKLSDDNKEIVNNIKCFSNSGAVLKKFHVSEKNPFGPTVYYQGYSFTGTFSSVDGEVGDNNDGAEDTAVTVYNNKHAVTHRVVGDKSTPKSGPKSEVEDLLSK